MREHICSPYPDAGDARDYRPHQKWTCPCGKSFRRYWFRAVWRPSEYNWWQWHKIRPRIKIEVVEGSATYRVVR